MNGSDGIQYFGFKLSSHPDGHSNSLKQPYQGEIVFEAPPNILFDNELQKEDSQHNAARKAIFNAHFLWYEPRNGTHALRGDCLNCFLWIVVESTRRSLIISDWLPRILV